MDALTRKCCVVLTWCKYRTVCETLKRTAVKITNNHKSTNVNDVSVTASWSNTLNQFLNVSGTNLLGEVICAGGNGAKSFAISASLGYHRKKYLFNCGEGTQRQIMLQTINTRESTPVRDIFVTHNSWNNVGGLTAFILDMMDGSRTTKNRSVRLHAPPDLENTIYTNDMHRWCLESMPIRKGVNFTLFDKRNYDQGQYEDELIRVEYVPLTRNLPDDKHPGNIAQFDTAVAFILHVKKQRSSEKAKPPIIVLECPSVEYLPSLRTSSRLLDLCDTHISLTPPEMIVHMSPTDVVAHPHYLDFMERYGDHTKHLLLNEECNAPVSILAVRYNSLMNYLNPKLFPELEHTTRMVKPRKHRHMQYIESEFKPHRLFNCFADQEQHLHKDNRQIDEKRIDFMNKSDDQEIHDAVKDLRERQEKHEKSRPGDEAEYPQVVFLGTASTVPQLYRNISCILVHTSADACMMLDCGEDSLCQLNHRFGARSRWMLCNLKAIFVSHIHLDHHGGILGVVNARKEAREKAGLPNTKLLVLVPFQMEAIFKRFTMLQLDLYENIHVQPHEYLQETDTDASHPFNIACQELQLEKCKPVPVVHTSNNSYGLVLTGRQGWKLVYSGDTAPCQRLVNEGQNCDLLIHEATFDDSYKDMAKANLHSTTSDAIAMSQQMAAKFTVLTHFSFKSQSFQLMVPKLPQNVGVAFDFMTIKLKTSELKTIQWHHNVLRLYLNQPQNSHLIV